jgi:carbonic anhydrase/acetyltransferase-like protein (isoleucine patch superfamily)
MIREVGGRRPEVDESAFVAEGVTVVGSVRIGAGASIWYGSVLRADTEDISVGANSNIQDGSVLHADPGDPVDVGERVTVGHGAVLHGAVVEDDCLIGMRATLLNGARIGSGSIVAAGAMVTGGKVIPPGSLVMGAPAKVVREVSDEERSEIAVSWREYVESAALHRAAGAGQDR